MAQNINITETVQAWADIVIKNWRHKIVELDIGVTGALYDSFVHEIISASGGNPEKIDFAFSYYGRFVDMGVGRGVYVGNSGDVQTRRKAKKWYGRTFFSETAKLRELLGEKYGILGAAVIKENIDRFERKQAATRPVGGDAGNRRQLAAVFPKSNSEISELDRVWMRRNGLLID